MYTNKNNCRRSARTRALASRRFLRNRLPAFVISALMTGGKPPPNNKNRLSAVFVVCLMTVILIQFHVRPRQNRTGAFLSLWGASLFLRVQIQKGVCTFSR
jgi:hypothetical protein